MTAEYIEKRFSDIVRFGNVIENRVSDSVDKEELIADNNQNLKACKKYGLEYILIDKKYKPDIKL